MTFHINNVAVLFFFSVFILLFFRRITCAKSVWNSHRETTSKINEMNCCEMCSMLVNKATVS